MSDGTLTQQAAAAMRENRVPEAVALLQQAHAATPDDFNTNYLLGVALAKSGRLSESIARLLKATQLNPTHTSALTHLGMAYAAAQKIEPARSAFQAALKIDPNFAAAQKALDKLPAKINTPAKPLATTAPASSAPPPPSPFQATTAKPTKTAVPDIQIRKAKSIEEQIKEVQAAEKKVKYETDWGQMGLQAAGAVIFVIGVGLWLGNRSRLFRTFPFAGFICMGIGAAMWNAAGS